MKFYYSAIFALFTSAAAFAPASKQSVQSKSISCRNSGFFLRISDLKYVPGMD